MEESIRSIKKDSKLQTLTREVWSSGRLQKEMRRLIRDPLKRGKSSLQVVFGRRREFLSSELLYLLVSLHFNLKKTEGSSLLVNMDRAPSAVQNNV